MSITPTDVGNIAAGIAGGGGLSWWLIKQAVGRMVSRVDELERKVRAIELAIAGDLMTKDDADQLGARLDALVATLDKVKDMVTRLDEREKVRHERD